MWSSTDWKLRQIKHRYPKSVALASVSTTTSAAAGQRRGNPMAPSAPSAKLAYSTALITGAPSASVPALPPVAVDLPAGDPMDLTQALAFVKGQSLKAPAVRKVCNDWQLCYYCKLQHPGKTAINCPNKGNKPSEVRALVLYDEIPANAEKA